MTKKKQHSELVSQSPRQDAFAAAWEKFRPLVPQNELQAVEESFRKSLSPAFRINRLKMEASRLPAMSGRYGWTLEPVPYCETGFRVREFQTAPSLTHEHRAGQYYIQDSASMLPVSLIDQTLLEEHPLILDLAASPGGKTTHLIDRSRDQGLILANDSSLSRIGALRSVLKNWGSLGQAITNFPGESFGGWFPDTFDIVLLDAPCSMQSLVSIDSHPMRPITEREENALAQRQTALLTSALQALKPGGQLVYSTCTLSPDEDEAVIDRMLRQFGGKIRVLDAARRLPWPAPGLTCTDFQTFDPSLTGSVRLWPHRYETAGFFACLLQKEEPFGSPVSDPPQRPWSKSSFSEVKAADIGSVSDWLKDQLGLDLAALLEEQECQLWQRGTEIWMLPQRFIALYASLPCKSIGMRMASATPAGWIPDNDWLSRFFSRVQGARLALQDPQQQESWLHGEDLRPDEAARPKGSIILATDDQGVFLGCGRVSGERIRNFAK